jgi:hypothetical protein
MGQRDGARAGDPFAPASVRPARALPPGTLLEQVQPTQSRVFRLAGDALRFETNDERVLDLAHDVFSAYGTAPDDAADPLVLRVMVAPAESPSLFRRPVFRTHGHLFTLALGPYDSGAADLLAGRAFAFVTPALVEVGWRLQQQVLSALALSMLGPARGYLPLHAACLTNGERSVVIYGSSGAGKSTFTYAAVRRGYRVVTEDSLQIGGADAPRAWGIPGRFGLLPDVTRFFPELTGLTPRMQANGEWKIGVDLVRLHPERVAVSAPLGPTLLLTRRPGPTAIERVPDDEASALVDPVWPWQVGWTPTHQALLDDVVRRGVYRFATGAEPDAMVDALDAFMAGRET